jgi:hypothetical protein
VSLGFEGWLVGSWVSAVDEKAVELIMVWAPNLPPVWGWSLGLECQINAFDVFYSVVVINTVTVNS